MELSFFGLSDKYMESVYEQFFQMKYFGAWSFMEAYNLPVHLRRWFYERLGKQIEQENEASKPQTKSHQRPPQARPPTK